MHDQHIETRLQSPSLTRRFAPRTVLREFGLALPESTAIRVGASTSEVCDMVLPEPLFDGLLQMLLAHTDCWTNPVTWNVN